MKTTIERSAAQTAAASRSDLRQNMPRITPQKTGLTYHLVASVSIYSPLANAVCGSGFTVSGAASCERLDDRDDPGSTDATNSITGVTVKLGAQGPFNATPTGTGTTPWATWKLDVQGSLPDGPLSIIARVDAAHGADAPGSATDTQPVVIDITPPSVAINPPADVFTPAPPYIAMISGSAADNASGIAAVEWQLPGGSMNTASGTTNWTAAVALPGLGSHTVNFRARDGAGNISAMQAVTVKVGDNLPPLLSIDVPSENAPAYPLVDGKVTVEVRGTASDTQTGVALVEWALDDSDSYSPATPKADDDWSSWSASVPITEAGTHTIKLRATDKAGPTGNVTPLSRAISVAEPFDPADPDAVFSPSAYLDGLLDFAGNRALASEGGAPLTRQQLEDGCLQAFTQLVTRDNRGVANQPASQVRLCVDVLRRYMALHEVQLLPEAEAGYRLAAYEVLLQGLGTSYDELRLARVASDASRAALASRLGIGLSQFRPDRLDALLFQPSDITEASLQQNFGLETTTIKPLADSLVPPAQLLIWQKEHLRAAWQQQDDAARTALDTSLPVIDPDLLVSQDLLSPSAGNAAFDLFQARQADLAAHLASLDALRKTFTSMDAAFDAIASSVLGPVDELLALADSQAQGQSIDDALKARRLTLPAFLHLMRVRELAVADSVLESEWDDVYAILVQARKLGLCADWRSQEQAQGVILSPDLFQLPDLLAMPAVVLPAWRATSQARQAWRGTLQARLQQDQALGQALQAVVSNTEATALPGLRDACVAAIAAAHDPAAELTAIADALTQELGIDCRDGGQRQTTRALQALETLQAVLLSLRTGRLKSTPPVLGTANPAAAWVLALSTGENPFSEADFDEEWLWMGGYATWNAAMRVFAYPESYLLPQLRPAEAQTAAYRALMNSLSNEPRLTPSRARDLASDYLATLTQPADAESPPPTLTPPLPDGFVITEQLTDAELSERSAKVQELFDDRPDPTTVPAHLQEVFYFVPMALALQLQKSGQYLAALDWMETVYVDHFAMAERKVYTGLVLEEAITTSYQRDPDTWLREALNPHVRAGERANAYTRFTLISLVRCYLDFADAEFTRDDGESIARARTLYANALALLAQPDMQAPPGEEAITPFPPNPLPQALQMRGELNLFKLRNGRNIAGIARQAPLVVQPAQTLDNLPTTTSSSQRQFRPTPYHYSVLIERAKNLVSIAQQVEQAFLAALEKRDAETYNLLKAGHDLQLASATVDLHALQVSEAEQGIGLAERQLDRAATQRDTYQGWIDDGLNQWESSMLTDYSDVRKYRIRATEIDAALTIAQSAVSAAAGGFFGTGLGGAWGGVAGVVTAAYARASATNDVTRAETSAQIDSAKASFERRNQEWELQRQLAENDIAIGNQQIVLAQTHTDIARQEAAISSTQRDQAQATVEFLARKFTSAELYGWMSGVLGGAYNYFLQQATAMAQLAQYQLAFERQETPPSFIQADYWEDSRDAAGGTSSSPNRQGLTGSVRLLQDITRLDQFAFDTNRRKLQLSESFSLARLFPVEFQQFRETGRLPFATPMSVFDQGFPGHYLRLIKRVSLSVVALVPPTRGLRATLIASGISRVVTGGDVFQPITVRRDPELIAFTGTSNATGLLDLEPDQGLLRPFESMGVDTNWELQLPKAANPFDFRSISDVLFTVEYTALQDSSYREQVIRQLDGNVSAECVISMVNDFADQWYALNNPEQSSTPMSVQLTLARDRFPPNLEDLRLQQVVLAVARTDGQSFEIGGVQLTLTPQGQGSAIGGTSGDSEDGLVSTRRGNGSAWVPLIGQNPAGNWTLTLPDSEEARKRFTEGSIGDILLILTYTGRAPAWPI